MSELLLKHFDLLVTAPDGVARLRELILTLAVRGLLVPQDPTDEPASVLLQKIRAEKDRLIAEGKIKRDKTLPPIADMEKPFDLPPGWEWVRLADVAWPQAGFAFKSSGFNEIGSGLPLIRIRDVGISEPSTFFSGEFRSEFLVHAGDWLVSMDGEFRVREWLGPPALLNQRVTRLIFAGDLVEKTFVCAALQGELTNLQGQKAYTTVDHLSGGQISSQIIPLPPLAEQSRIVTRVEELMRLCDAVDANRKLDATQHAQLLHTLLDTLTDSATPEELAYNWQRASTHFDLLLDRPEAVDALEQTILQLAVRGLLVPQDPADEPASVLLQRIRTEKDRLIAEGKIKRDKPLPPIADEEKPLELPVGWEWVSIEMLADVGTGTTPSRDNVAFFAGGSIPWVTSGETGNPFIARTAQHVTELALSDTSLTMYPIGTLIVAMYGQGKTRGQVSELQIEATTNQACAAIVLFEPSAVHRSYVKLVFEKSYDEIRELSAGGAQPNLNVGKIKSTLIPLPPLAEQTRIVTRVEELRQLCNDLRQRLIDKRTTQRHLAEALVEDLAA